MIPAFVRRREPEAGYLTNVAVVHQRAYDPQTIGTDAERMGMSSYTPLEEPTRYSETIGGRGRPVFPAATDTVYYQNPWTMLGGEGASWEWEHFGLKQPMLPKTLAGGYDAGTYGAANHPLDGHAGMVAWPERANEYRPPYESYGSVIDQRTPNVAPDWTSAQGANPLV